MALKRTRFLLVSPGPLLYSSEFEDHYFTSSEFDAKKLEGWKISSRLNSL